jgi:hypothetical protein
MPAPNAVGPQACRYCGAPVLPVLPPSRPQAYGASPSSWLRQYGWILGLFLAVGVIGYAVVKLGVPFAGGEPKVLLRTGGWVPVGKAATPIRVQPIIRQQGRRVVVTVHMTDANGGTVRAIRGRGGRRPDAPRVAIYDAEGSLIYRCRLSYG